MFYSQVHTVLKCSDRMKKVYVKKAKIGKYENNIF